ncbi:ABC transporter ATP-binding protein [Chondrinema litorale]|uniref:ABC transporter ATP-binding protein n=1 Tax=Chondrinema litorale TaxID=2994555 RepID=UPI0025438C50|nr:ABC transporter ATP-binding protein [Chondrinema litorale]UZR93401.1 ABC transporter ATP-binding protein [Chondrinema litorale]
MTNKENYSGKVFDAGVLSRIFQYVKPYIGWFYILVFLTVLVAALSPVRPYLIQITIDRYVAAGDVQGLINMVILMVVLIFFQAGMEFCNTYLSGWLGQNIIKDLRIKLYQHILSLKLSFFDRTAIGRLVTRNISDIETLSDVFTNGLAAIIGDLLQLVFIFAFMIYEDWKLTLVSMSVFPFMVISTYVFKEKIKYAFSDVRNAVSNLNSFVQEHITGMSIVQIFNSEKREYDKFEDINKEHLRANVKTVFYYSIYFPVAEVLGAVGTGLVVWYGAKGVIDDRVSLGVLIQFIMYISLFFRPLRQIADRFNTLQLGIVSSDRILKLLDNTDHIQNTGNKKVDHFDGNVKFENVFFAYKNNDYVLKDISFEVNPGETLAFVGATGAGKSSIINLISRFYEINKGEISIDGVPVNQYELQSLRSHIAVVLQDVFLFSDTIENNITLGNPDISREQIMEAAELVGAKEFIDRLPGGLDYNVMERGSTLSVGQRQLISFVRAIVYDPKIIILDEATSSVDSETEEMIQEAIEKLMKGRTAIVIAHRLSTIQKADQIIVLDKGKIMEKGRHEELLEQKGFYTNLYKIQYKEVI